MTSVSVKLANGTARSFNTSFTSKDVVKSVALADAGFTQNLAALTVQQELEVLAVLDSVYSNGTDRVIANDSLAAAGITEVLVGLRPAAPVAAPVLEDDEDDEVPAVEDLPVYNATVEAQERPASPARFTGSTPAQFKVPATVSRVAALVLAGATLVAGVVAGGVIF